jgi:ribosome-associated translation inhibitor RaiA
VPATATSVPSARRSGRYLRRKLGAKLGKFAPAIERVRARVEDVNGPRGGLDKRCRIKVVQSGLPSVMAEEQHNAVRAATDRALDRIETALRRTLERRHTLATRGRTEAVRFVNE